MKKIKLDKYLETLTDYHSGGSYKTLAENTKILHNKDYAVMVRTLNFENDDFLNNLIYCDKSSYEFLTYSHVYENDILINKIANPGSVYIMPKVDYKATCGMNLFLLRPKNINPRYLYYVMKANEKYIKSKSHGTTTKTITKEDVRKLEFKVHETLYEQDLVTKLLSSIDYILINNKKMIRKQNELLNILFSYYFLQFDFPAENGKPYKSSGGKMVYNKQLKMEIPYGWDVCLFDDVVNKVNGFAFSSEDYCEGGIYKIYTIKNVQDGYVLPETDNHINEIPSSMNRECVLEPGDIILSLTGNVGRSGLVFEKKALLNQRVLKISPKDIPKSYLYALVQNENFKKFAERLAVGTTQKNLSPIQLGKIPIIFPSKDILIYFDKLTAHLTDAIVSEYIENAELKSLRNFLLPLLMNGQATINR